MHVDTHISGSYCVIWKTKEHYIDCRKSSSERFTDIECVRNGQVYIYAQVHNEAAPEYVLKLVKQQLLKV